MIDQAQIHAEFTDAAELAEQFARLSQGASVVFCRGPGSWARFPHATAALVQGWGEFTQDSKGLTELAALRPAALKIIEEVDFDN